uniref:4Fe-4S ferredoxin-type domain-containing protein n=1 Tax=Angiostrongylus cantonensis TaxID=6313 RepID=A0A0K0DP14_ANGCA
MEGLVGHGRISRTRCSGASNHCATRPNGRFELNKKICLSISGYHPETWLPSWSIRTALLALIGFMPSAGAGALGSLEYPIAERRKLAKKSVEWKCKQCGACMKDVLKPLTEDAKKSNEEAKELAAQLSFKVGHLLPLFLACLLETRGLLEDHRNNYNGISLFVTLPICMVFLSLFGLLLVRRFLL